jgi:hypothetical protein
MPTIEHANSFNERLKQSIAKHFNGTSVMEGWPIFDLKQSIAKHFNPLAVKPTDYV